MKCEIVYVDRRKGKKLLGKACDEDATWVIRENGKQFYACNTHKTCGVQVRKVN